MQEVAQEFKCLSRTTVYGNVDVEGRKILWKLSGGCILGFGGVGIGTRSFNMYRKLAF